MILTTAHVRQFEEDGYFVLERVIPEADLERLRAEAERYVGLIHAEMDARGVDTIRLSLRHKRYFVTNRYQDSPFLRKFLFGDLMAEITRRLVGDDVYLFLELFVVKCAEVGMEFSWHQDSGYMRGAPHRPYLSCWCALDDMTEENGTIYVLPYGRAGTRAVLPHAQDGVTNDLVGYSGDDPGVPVVVPAGSVAVFSSTTLHRSSANRTGRPRRVYLAEYSPEPITHADGSKLWSLAVPFFRNGVRVANGG
jgi:ectoine hydroxylase-related dioxygenase (phytanoyl-CoA dioxygenase family)